MQYNAITNHTFVAHNKSHQLYAKDFSHGPQVPYASNLPQIDKFALRTLAYSYESL